jgi:light-regulated signal transduction histidine kinase (bacteriophytochrome)
MGLTDDNINFESLRAFVRSGYRVIDAESHEIGPDGENKVFLINTIGILENGHLVRAWGTQRDITEKKRAEEEIRKLNAELEERVAQRTSQLEIANKELESFSYSISHDLRAPLRAIIGFSNILRNDFSQNMEPPGKNFLDKIIAAAAEMHEKVDALLALSRLTRSALRYEPLDLSQMAETVIERLRSTESGRKVACIVAPALEVSADKALMQTLLENLLGNAWKYSSKNSEAQIEFGTCQEQDGQKVFFVRDNGAGFDMRYAEKLFGAFQRLHRNDEFQGHGIGLATVKKIVEHHGGRIWAEAEVGKGATFYFTIP